MKYFLLCLAFLAPVAHAAEPSVLVYNITQNKVEHSRNIDQVRPVASVTKLMTAMIALDYDKDLGRKLPLSNRVGSSLPRQQYTREQLLSAMLIKSDNAAAETLAEDYPGGRSAFIIAMNRQATQWDMTHTHFADASGLSAENTSTANDIANMVQIASGYWFIRETSAKKQVAFETKYKKKIRTINLAHTSGQLLFVFDNVLISKTGLTSAAGWCVGMLVEQDHKQFVVVVLGSKTKKARLDTVKNIMYNHILDTNLNGAGGYQ